MKQDLIKINLSPLARISTRAGEVDVLAKFHTFTEDKLQRVAADMPEINRATRSLGKSKTQTSNRLMTLTMLADASPYRALYQCLSQIEQKRIAVKEHRFKLLRDRVKLERAQAYLQECENSSEKQLIEIDIEELTSNISDAMLYIEGALKTIASFQSSYKQICKNKNIPENWDEQDLEKAEVKHHLRMAFLHAYRDLMATGRLGMGTLEYLQQFGVHPHVASAIVSSYITKSYSDLDAGDIPDYEDLEIFLDNCVGQFENSYKQVLTRVGLDNLWEDWCMYTEDKL